MIRRALCTGLAALAAWAPLALGCSDDPDLGKDPPTGSTSTGTGGAGGAGGGGTGGAGGSVPVEPDGPARLTVVNGVVDHDAIRICFLPYPDGTGAGVAPWPGAGGLAFAAGAAIDPPSTVIPEGQSVRPHVVAGDLGATAGLDCAEILALASGGGPAPVVAAALPVVPPSAFEAARSLLLVPMGCLGGEGHTATNEALICGAGYSPATPTATLAAVAMSRLATPGKLGLQVVHASLGLPAVDVRVAPSMIGAEQLLLAPNLTPGAVGPFPPFSALSAAEYGPFAQVVLQTFPPGEMVTTSAVPMSEAFAHSDVAPNDLVDGKGFVLVAVGADPSAGSGTWWRKLTYGLVKADPAAE